MSWTYIFTEIASVTCTFIYPSDPVRKTFSVVEWCPRMLRPDPQFFFFPWFPWWTLLGLWDGRWVFNDVVTVAACLWVSVRAGRERGCEFPGQSVGFVYVAGSKLLSGEGCPLWACKGCPSPKLWSALRETRLRHPSCLVRTTVLLAMYVLFEWIWAFRKSTSLCHLWLFSVNRTDELPSSSVFLWFWRIDWQWWMMGQEN